MSADSRNSDKKWSFHLLLPKPTPSQILEGAHEGHEDRITKYEASGLFDHILFFVLFASFVVLIRIA